MTPARAQGRPANGGVRLQPLELTSPVGEAPPSREDVRFLLTLHGAPVGAVEVPAGADCERRALQCHLGSRDAGATLDLLARWATAPARGGASLGTLWRSGPPAGDDGLATLTVAVCTRDRPGMLALALEALRHVPRHGVDLLVVDNAPSTGDTRALVEQRFPMARYVREDRPGLDHARNRALAESSATVVAFCDDDAVAEVTWCDEMRRLFARNPDLTIATGLVEPAALDAEAARWFEAYAGFGRGFRRRWVIAPRRRSIAFPFANTGEHGTGANLAIRRVHALALGGFDPALDVGTPTDGGGDLEMMFRVLKAGGLLAYHPAAVVRHHHRDSREALVRQLEGWGTGMVAHLARTARACPEERLGVLALRCWLAWWSARSLARSLLRPRYPFTLHAAESRGRLRGARLYEAASRAHPPPGRPVALHDHGGRPAHTEARDIELAEASGPLHTPEADRLRLRVTQRGRRLGEVEVCALAGMVGEDRWRDAVARAFRPALLGMGDREARRALLHLTVGQASR